MEYAMIIDYGHCTGCESCTISCQKEKSLPSGDWGIAVKQIGPKKLGGAWEWDYLPVPSSACDLCSDRLEGGKMPLCQLHCLAAVIEVMPLNEVPRRMAEIGSHKVTCFLP